MKKGIVRVPEWAKEAFKNGVDSIDFRENNCPVRKVMILLDGNQASYGREPYWEDDQEGYVWPESWIESVEESIDWKRVKVDAPIEVFEQVTKLNPGKWINVHFALSDDNGCVYFYSHGLTGHTARGAHSNCSLKMVESKDAKFPQGVNPEDWYK